MGFRGTILVLLLLVLGACRFDGGSGLHENRPSEDGPTPPKWARLNPLGVNLSVDSPTQVTMTSPKDGPGAVQGEITADTRVVVARGRIDDVNAALTTSGFFAPEGEPKTLIPDDKGHLPDTVFNGDAYGVLVLTLNSLTADKQVPLTAADLQECRALAFLIGDLNFDGVIAQEDYDLFMTHWTMEVPPGEINMFYGDFNKDGKVNFSDFVTLNNNWGRRIANWPTSSCR